MKIQPNTTANHPINAAACKKGNANTFCQILNNHMQANVISTLVKDAFSDVKAEILNEIENLTSDETGQNIDMAVLDDLLKLAIESK